MHMSMHVCVMYTTGLMYLKHVSFMIGDQQSMSEKYMILPKYDSILCFKFTLPFQDLMKKYKDFPDCSNICLLKFTSVLKLPESYPQDNHQLRQKTSHLHTEQPEPMDGACYLYFTSMTFGMHLGKS